MNKKLALLIALSIVGVQALVATSPSFAKAPGKVKGYRTVSPPPSYVRIPPALSPQIVRCRHGVWDAYGARCDRMIE